jgi:hypothetical protein
MRGKSKAVNNALIRVVAFEKVSLKRLRFSFLIKKLQRALSERGHTHVAIEQDFDTKMIEINETFSLFLQAMEYHP